MRSSSCFLFPFPAALLTVCSAWAPMRMAGLPVISNVYSALDDLNNVVDDLANKVADEVIGSGCFDFSNLKFNNMDPEADMTVKEIIQYHGYPVEEHDVTTDDGYILTIHRIAHGLGGTDGTPRKPVIVQHGFLCSSAIWVINTPDKNLAYVLAEEGFDVWLTNVRGSRFGRKHVCLDPADSEFWKFSVDEMIEYDMPAIIDFVLNTTGFDQVHYIGHSMGSMIAFGLLSTKLEYNAKIRDVLALGPAATLTHMRSPLRMLIPVLDNLPFLHQLVGGDEFLPNDKLSRFFSAAMCKWPLSRELYSSLLFVLFGSNKEQMNMTRLPVYLHHTPAGTSLQNMMHLLQIHKSQRFQHYDHGKAHNFRLYRQYEAPEYDVSQITAPVALFWSDNDILVDAKDVADLDSKLKNVILNYRVSDPKFTHMDFMWAKDAKLLVYDKMVEVMKSQWY